MYERYKVYFKQSPRNWSEPDGLVFDSCYASYWKDTEQLLNLCDRDPDKCRDFIFSVMDGTIWSDIEIPSRFRVCFNYDDELKSGNAELKIIVRDPDDGLVAVSAKVIS